MKPVETPDQPLASDRVVRSSWALVVAVCLLAGCADEPVTHVETDPPGPAEIGALEAEPLVPPIDLGGPIAAIRSIDGLHGSDPLGLDQPIVDGADFTKDERASFHAHGDEVCASGCAASRHPTPPLSREEFDRLMVEFARGPMDESNQALESLCFYGRQTEAWIEKFGTRPLSQDRAAFLKRELERTHALISFRIVDEFGDIRTSMPPTRVPFDRRHVFDMETERLPPLETSGTVKRVGLHHLWTRL